MTAADRRGWDAPARAQLALLLEVCGTPKPGNVDREREYPTLRFEHFLTGAVGARTGLSMATDPDTSLGRAFETAVAGMAAQRGGNTQFGALLVVCPLVRAVATRGTPTPETVSAVTASTGVEDCVAFFEAFEHVDVAVDDPPADLADLDVRRGGEAAAAIRDEGMTLGALMEASADRDGVAAEWTTAFDRTFQAASIIEGESGPISHRGAVAFLRLLAEEPDTFVATKHGSGVAEEITERAAAVLAAADGDPSIPVVRTFAENLTARGINPGTTADLVAGGLYIALERGVRV